MDFVRFNELMQDIDTILGIEGTKGELMQDICDYLKGRVPHYDWVGFYLVNPENDRELFLGPYAGLPTDHKVIPFGKGICGQAAEREQTFVVDDVTKETNYLACSPKVRSEIVIPLFKNGRVLGELDIDSDKPGAFTEKDQEFLKEIAGKIEAIL